jgi:hypothetical protein
MKTTLKFFATILLISITKIALSQSVTFERYYDFGFGEIEEANCVQQTFDGGYIMAGRSGQGSSTKFLIAKVDSMGISQWHKAYGNNGTYNSAQSIFQTADSGFIVTGGMMETNGLNYVGLLKLNNIGDSLWLKKFIYTNQNAVWGVKVTQNTDGGFTLLSDVVDSTDTKWTVFLTRTDANGNELWTKKYKKEQGTATGSYLATQDTGYIIATFTNPSINDNDIYLIKTNTMGDTLWTKTIAHPPNHRYFLSRSNCINTTLDGGYIITGTAIVTNSVLGYILIIKINAQGDTLWTKKIGDNDRLWGEGGGIQTMDGGFIIGGMTENTSTSVNSDIYILKTDSLGNEKWNKSYGGSIDEFANYIIKTTENGFVICGMETSWGDSGGIYLIKTDSMGNAQSYINSIKNNISVPNLSIEIYPNPFIESAKVLIKTQQTELGTFTIINSTGTVIKVYEVKEALFDINKENLTPGIYYGVFQSENLSNSLPIKFIIQ